MTDEPNFTVQSAARISLTLAAAFVLSTVTSPFLEAMVTLPFAISANMTGFSSVDF